MDRRCAAARKAGGSGGQITLAAGARPRHQPESCSHRSGGRPRQRILDDIHVLALRPLRRPWHHLLQLCRLSGRARVPQRGAAALAASVGLLCGRAAHNLPVAFRGDRLVQRRLPERPAGGDLESLLVRDAVEPVG